nr:hypothetical protein BaRGS_032766 [Batillaria attramentaria]
MEVSKTSSRTRHKEKPGEEQQKICRRDCTVLCLQATWLLLEWGSMPNIRDKWGQSPLHYSICAQFLDTASILLEHMDASAVEIINDKDRYGKTPLHSAADSANVEAIEILLKHGADVNIRNFDGITPLMVCAETCGRSKSVRALEVLIDGGALINLVDYRSKRSALQRAAVAKNVAAVEFLLSMGADIDSLDNTYRTALTNVMWDHVRNREGMCNIDPDVMTIIILLTQAGANLDLAMSEYCNPLVTAAFLQAPVLVRFFLDQGAQPNVNFMSGVTPLLVSTSKKDVDAVKIFLTYNCDMTIKGRVRRRRVDFIFDPMEMALEDKNYHLVQMFLAAGYPSNFVRQQLEERLKSDPNGQSSGLDPDLSQWLLKRISCPSTLRVDMVPSDTMMPEASLSSSGVADREILSVRGEHHARKLITGDNSPASILQHFSISIL